MSQHFLFNWCRIPLHFVSARFTCIQSLCCKHPNCSQHGSHVATARLIVNNCHYSEIKSVTVSIRNNNVIAYCNPQQCFNLSFKSLIFDLLLQAKHFLMHCKAHVARTWNNCLRFLLVDFKCFHNWRLFF